MVKSCSSLLIAMLLAVPASFAQYDASTGPPSHNSSKTGQGPNGMGGQSSGKTGKQNVVNLPTGLGQLAKPPGSPSLQALPPCVFDSNVKMNEAVFGDEGIDDIPPYFGFDKSHRLKITIADPNPELSTFHGSMLPDAWGKDEFIGGPEMDMSGPSN